MNTPEKDDKPAFTKTDRGYTITCWYPKDMKGPDAIVEITKDGQMVRNFLFPAYKIYNLAAHFSDIVDSELESNLNGYREAASTGFGGSVAYTEIKP